MDDGKASACSLTTGYRLVALDARDRRAIPSCGKGRHRELKRRGRGRQGATDRLARPGRSDCTRTPAITQKTTKKGRSGDDRRRMSRADAEDAQQTRRACARLRTCAPVAVWDVNHHPRRNSANETWLNESWAGTGTRRLEPDRRRRRPRTGLSSGRERRAPTSTAACVRHTTSSPERRVGHRLTGPARGSGHFKLVHNDMETWPSRPTPMLVDLTVERAAGEGGCFFVLVDGQAGVPTLQPRTGEDDSFRSKNARAAGRMSQAERHRRTQPFPEPDRRPTTIRASKSRNLIEFTPECHAGVKIASALQARTALQRRSVRQEDGTNRQFRIVGEGTNARRSYIGQRTSLLRPSFVAIAGARPAAAAKQEFSDSLPYAQGNALHRRALHFGPGKKRWRQTRRSLTVEGRRDAGSRPAMRHQRRCVPQGLPLLRPPYGRSPRIDRSRRRDSGQVAHGERRTAAQSPGMKGLTIPRHGTYGAVGRWLGGDQDAGHHGDHVGDDASPAAAADDDAAR